MSLHDPLVSTKQLSEEMGVCERTIIQMREDGDGPEFIKIGRLVRYRRSTIDTWYAERTYDSLAAARREKEKTA